MRWVITAGLVALVATSCGSRSDGAEEPPLFAEMSATVTASAAATAESTPSADEIAVEDPIEQSEDEPVMAEEIDAELFPIVVGVTAAPSGDGAFRFDVTLSSEYDTPERYADAWRVLDADDAELGIRVLTHDHAGEQPFTRSTNVDVPSGTTTVFIEGRDQANGWSGQRFEHDLAG